jgi:hypothetical protein
LASNLALAGPTPLTNWIGRSLKFCDIGRLYYKEEI